MSASPATPPSPSSSSASSFSSPASASSPPAGEISTPQPDSTPSDLDLLRRCRDGDLEAFDEIVGRHQNRIYNLCCWRLGDADEAADAAQDTFVRAWKAIQQFRGDCAFSTWLHRIALNVTHDAATRRSRAPLAFSSLAPPATGNTAGDADADSIPDPSDPAEGPEQSAARRERRQAVRDALAQLPVHYRVVLVLFDMEGRSYEEAAALLELPLGTVKSRLNRARLALRRELEERRELFED